jgi:superfamily I DNA and/or RNA helicase
MKSFLRGALILNEDQHLILVKNQDKTGEIETCRYENKKWLITYKNNGKKYPYNYLNVTWLKSPKTIDPETTIIYENNQPITGITRILLFDGYVKLHFQKGFKRTIKRSSIIMEETCLTNNTARSTFEYLKALANHVSIKLDEDVSFLRKQYNNIKMISPRSVLAAYLEGKPLGSEKSQSHPIFPFGFNISQKLATEKALTNQVSIIEGPPGTGKTQTILNIIANAVINNKSVAVVSNNNSATANVLEKLEKYEVDFIAAYLGNNENKKKFFENQTNTYPKMANWKLSDTESQSLRTKIVESQKKLDEMLVYQNKRALLKQELSNMEREFAYFVKYLDESNLQSIYVKSILKYNSEKVLKFLVQFRQNIDKGKIAFREKIYNLIFHGLYNFKIYKLPPESMVSFLQKTYYEKKISELKDEIEKFSKKLEFYHFDQEMKELSSKSMKLFKAKLADRYNPEGSRIVFNADALWKEKEFERFINEYPVILSTTHSLRNCSAKNYLFDYVIIDEASQVDIITGALALSCAKNAVIVGDVKQLPNVVTSETAMKAEGIFKSYGVEESYHYAKQSLLSSFLSLYQTIPKTLLKEHYRCHPKIIGFCNQKFYNNELVILTNEQEHEQPLTLYKTAKGNHARGKVNQRQIDVIFNEILPEKKINPEQQSVGIISPYRLQANELQKVIGNQKIDADTVHKFQGRERDIIILTTVANQVEANDFVDEPNLINVAVSRAVDQLIVVVSEGSEEWKGTNIGDLIRYIQYNNFEIIESQIYSVFDLLYNSYSDRLLETMKRSKKVSEHKSENLMNAVIEKVLSAQEFQTLDWVLHQPLRMLIRDKSKLTSEELKFAMNILTHTDFVIFNKIDKMPVLVVEVDGHAYHANNPVQLERDEMKDEILRKYNIPIIRMKTTGSREEEIFREKVEGILKIN